MSDQDLERERIACVFGLGSGELHEPHPDAPDEWDGQITYWYDGTPDYAELKDVNCVECPCKGLGDDRGDCDRCEGYGLIDLEVRTAIIDCLWGERDPPSGWERIASFTSSGEASCWWCGEGTGNEEEREDCELCESDGLIYLGEGWCEVVYRRITDRDPDAG